MRQAGVVVDTDQSLQRRREAGRPGLGRRRRREVPRLATQNVGGTESRESDVGEDASEGVATRLPSVKGRAAAGGGYGRFAEQQRARFVDGRGVFSSCAR